MLRSILAIVAGYVVMSVITIAAVFALVSAAGLSFTAQPPPQLPLGYLIANLASGFIAAAVGGLIAATVANRARRRHALLLALLILSAGVAYALSSADTTQPAWYRWTLPLIGALGAAAGGWLRHNRPTSVQARVPAL